MNWDWSLGYIDIPIDLNDVNASAEDFFLNVGVFGGVDEEFATDQYVNILLSESDAPFNDNVNNNAADIFGTGSEVYKHQIRPVDWEGWRYFAIPYSEFEVKSEGGNNVREPSEIRGFVLDCKHVPSTVGIAQTMETLKRRQMWTTSCLQKDCHCLSRNDEKRIVHFRNLCVGLAWMRQHAGGVPLRGGLDAHS